MMQIIYGIIYETRYFEIFEASYIFLCLKLLPNTGFIFICFWYKQMFCWQSYTSFYSAIQILLTASMLLVLGFLTNFCDM
jgi:hypothetical protein